MLSMLNLSPSETVLKQPGTTVENDEMRSHLGLLY